MYWAMVPSANTETRRTCTNSALCGRDISRFKQITWNFSEKSRRGHQMAWVGLWNVVQTNTFNGGRMCRLPRNSSNYSRRVDQVLNYFGLLMSLIAVKLCQTTSLELKEPWNVFYKYVWLLYWLIEVTSTVTGKIKHSEVSCLKWPSNPCFSAVEVNFNEEQHKEKTITDEQQDEAAAVAKSTLKV